MIDVPHPAGARFTKLLITTRLRTWLIVFHTLRALKTIRYKITFEKHRKSQVIHFNDFIGVTASSPVRSPESHLRDAVRGKEEIGFAHQRSACNNSWNIFAP
jgi:hypothetical protein